MKRILCTAATVFTVVLSTAASASTITDYFTSFWVLGDSLSDNGNLFEATGNPPFPYFSGRFSNGPVWNESLIGEFTASGNQPPVVGAPGVGSFEGNFAYGGSRTSGDNEQGPIPGLDQQVGLFSAFTDGLRGENPLVSIWAGANNILQDIDERRPVRSARQAANDVAAAIQALSGLGVDNFLVFNLPDIGLTPGFLGTEDQRLATRMTDSFNRRLDRNIDQLELRTGVNIIDIDVNEIFASILADLPGSGYTNGTDACIANLDPRTTTTPCNPASWLFWDGVHPTALAHAQIDSIVRQRLEYEISAVPLPASGLLLVFGLGALVIARRRTA